MNFGDIKDRAISAWKETEDYFKKITPITDLDFI